MSYSELSDEKFQEVIRDAIQKGGKSSAMSQLTGIPIGTLNKYVSKTSMPSAINAIKIAKALGTTLDILLTGERGTRNRNSELGIGRESVLIPVYNVSASAGGGAIAPMREMSVKAYPVHKTLLKEIGVSPNKCQFITAMGDSMMPTIPDRSLLLIDFNQQEIVNGWIVVINVAGRLLVKRIYIKADGEIELISDNPLYPNERLPSDGSEQINIIGRVVYICRQM